MGDSSERFRVMKLHILSERCSGSNFVETAINDNLPVVHSDRYGFKHWLDENFLNETAFPADTLFLIVMRSPFDWLRSMHRQPWHCAPELTQLTFSEFIRAPWRCVWDEQAGVARGDSRWMTEMMFERNPLDNNRRFRNVLEVRQVKYGIWQDRLSSHPHCIHLSFEKFKASPERMLSEIARAQDLKAPERIKISQGYKGTVSWKRKIALLLSFGTIGRYAPKPKSPIALDDIDYILSNLDPGLESVWEYDIEAIADAERKFTQSTQQREPRTIAKAS